MQYMKSMLLLLLPFECRHFLKIKDFKMIIYLMNVLDDDRNKRLHLQILNLLCLITKLKVLKISIYK